jgi:hypothetical protein
MKRIAATTLLLLLLQASTALAVTPDRRPVRAKGTMQEYSGVEHMLSMKLQSVSGTGKAQLSRVLGHSSQVYLKKGVRYVVAGRTVSPAAGGRALKRAAAGLRPIKVIGLVYPRAWWDSSFSTGASIPLLQAKVVYVG